MYNLLKLSTLRDRRNLFNNEHAAQNTLSESKYLVLNQIDLSSEVYNLYQGLVVQDIKHIQTALIHVCCQEHIDTYFFFFKCHIINSMFTVDANSTTYLVYNLQAL